MSLFGALEENTASSKELIYRIIDILGRKKVPCYAISPHLDDAIFSAGGLLGRLSREGIPVTIVTMFTQGASSPYTWVTRRYMQRSGDYDAATYFEKRRAEDRDACALLEVECIHVGLIDAGWRKSNHPLRIMLGTLLPELSAVYPLGGRSRRIAHVEYTFVDKMVECLHRAIDASTPALLLCPIAEGRHVDHLLVRQAVLKGFPAHQVMYWDDFPYSMWSHVEEQSLGEHVGPITLQPSEWDVNQKQAAMKAYESQVPVTFPNATVPIVAENYFVHAQTVEYLELLPLS